MSSSPAIPSGNAAGASPQRTQAPSSRSTGGPNAAAGNSDLFSNLLALLSATHDLPTPGVSDTEGDEKARGHGLQGDTDVSQQNPLASLLGWADASRPETPPNGSEQRPGSTNPSIGTPITAAGSQLQGSTMLLGARPDTPPPGQHNPLPGDAANTQGQALQGMSWLEAPVAPDASTMAALSRASGGEATSASPAAAKPIGSETSPRPAAWRSTVSPISPPGAPPAPASQSAGNDKTLNLVQGWVAQTRSTVALDERFAMAQASDDPLTGSTAATGTRSGGGGQAQGGSSGSPGAAPEHLGLDAAVESHEQPDSDTPFATPVQETEDLVEAPWSLPSLRQASLRVGEAGEDPIDIQLALSGQELNVEFRTDNSEARATLAQEASQSLGELLERSGIQLGHVSVGTQHQPPGESGRGPAHHGSTQARGRPAGTVEQTAATATVEQRPRTDGSRPLDLFV